MSDFSGRKVAYGIAKEATRGTAVLPTYWISWMAAEVADTAKTVTNDSAINVLDKSLGAAVTETSGGGKIDGIVTDQAFGLLLYACLGSHAVAAHTGETLVYDHTFTESQSNQAQSLTITRKDPNVVNQFALAMLKTLEIDVVTGEYVKFTSDWVTQPSVSNTASVTEITENNFISKNATVKLATNLAGLTAATAIPIKDFKITIEKDVNPYFVLGQNNPNEIFSQETTVKGDFTLRYTDDTYKTLRFNNTPQALLLDLKNTAVTIGTAANPELQIQMPQIFLTDWKPAQPIAGMVEQTITFEGTFSIGSAYMLQAIFTNTVATY